jgi:hypothetical protein
MPFQGPFNVGPMGPMQMQHRFGPPPQMQPSPMFPPMHNQMNFQPSPQMTQVRLPGPPFYPMNQNMPPQSPIPPFPAQMMTPPRPEIPQFRLINPAPQQLPQMPNFERPQSHEPQESQPMPQPEVRIQLRRIQLPGPISDIFPFLNNINNDMQKEIEAPRESSNNNNIQVQQVPLAVALSKVGITPDDLRNIQRMAEEKFQQHIRELVADDADNDSSSIDSESSQSDEIESSGMATDMPDSEEKNSNQESQLNGAKSEERQEILSLGRSNFGRSLNPIQLPVRPEIQEAERADCELTIIILSL